MKISGSNLFCESHIARHKLAFATILLLLLVTALDNSMPAPAFGQSGTGLAPIRETTDENGVEVSTGRVNIPVQGISIGDAENGMVFERYLQNSQDFIDNQESYAILNGYTFDLSVTRNGSTETFSSGTGSIWYSDQGNGATATFYDPYDFSQGFQYVGADGTVIEFTDEIASTGSVAYYYPDYVVTPSGKKIDYHYRTEQSCGGGYCFDITRIQSITDNQGFQAKYDYESNSISSGAPAFTNITSVTLINNAVEYCSPSADTCSFANAWPTLSFSTATSGSNTVTSVTDTLNQVTQFTFNSNLDLVAIKRPSSSSDDVSISYQTGYPRRVTSITAGGMTTNYSFSWDSGTQVLTGVASDSVGTKNTTTAIQYSGNLLTSKDGLNRMTTYSYDSNGRLEAVHLPEGNKVEYDYDGRGNVTETRRVAKSGSGLADIVTTAGFDTTCSNVVVCNKPNWTKDALGNQTDYTYDGTTGQLLTVTSPAASSGGTRPKVSFAYAPHYAWYKKNSSVIVQATDPISKLVSTSSCVTGTPCSGTIDERRTEISYEAGSSGNASNLFAVSTTVKSGNGAVSSTTALNYDDVGNAVSVDGPLSGAGDMTVFRYDTLRRRVGTIGPDPDGGGPRVNAASRMTYDGKGRVTTVEQGTTAGQSDTAWANFAAADKTVTTYDNADRPLTETLSNGSTSYALTQYSYDARGRLDCTAVRMNPAEYASLPSSACTHDTEGSHGKDRIVKRSYDAANQVTQVETGYGTAAAVTEEMAYTTNGQLAYVTDGEDNRTTMEYDGHDRLLKTRYPATTQGANSSSTTDYEELTYNANGNVTQLRLRDGNTITMTYDDLGRLTSRTPNGEYAASYSYNLVSEPTAISRSGDSVTQSYEYDGIGRLSKATQPHGWVSYQYDAAGRRTRLTWDDSIYVDYDYDSVGNVTAIRENGASSGIGVLASYAYDNLGRRTSVSFGNGTSRTYEYDPVSRLTGLKLDLSGTSNDHTIGLVGGSGSAIAYNPASQISQIGRSNGSYAWNGHVNVNRTYTSNGLNQYSSAGATSFSYDGRGNLTASGSDSYGYNLLNRMTSAVGSTLSYDVSGRLIELAASSGTTRFIFDGGLIVAEENSTGSKLRRYVHGPGVDEPIVWYEGADTSDRRFLQADERGSVIVISDSAGSAIQINSYSPYGIPSSTNIGRFQYTGQAWLDEVGLAYYKARMYSPTLGRFMQSDPIGYADGLNLYAYAGNDPVNATDPSGNSENSIVVRARPYGGGGAFLYGLAFSNWQQPDLIAGVIGWRIVLGHMSPPGGMQEKNKEIVVTATRVNRGNGLVPIFKSLISNSPQNEECLTAADCIIVIADEHKKGARPSTRNKHEEGNTRRGTDRGGEKGDARRRPPRKRPPNWKGPWPPIRLFPPIIIPEWMLDPCLTGIAFPECGGPTIAYNFNY